MCLLCAEMEVFDVATVAHYICIYIYNVPFEFLWIKVEGDMLSFI